MSDIDKKPKPLRRAQDLTAADRAAIIRQLEFGSTLERADTFLSLPTARW